MTEAGAAALHTIQGRQFTWANRCADGISPAELLTARAFPGGLSERHGA
jgi:hypothetical protein